jgi:hypothetical protein
LSSKHQRSRGTHIESRGDIGVISAVDRHIAQYIGPVLGVFHEIKSDRLHVDVHIVKPAFNRDCIALVTSGMSELPMAVPEGFESWSYSELMMCLPVDWPLSSKDFKEMRNYWPIWLLKAMARYPHDNETWIGAGHTVMLDEEMLEFFPQFTSTLILRSQLLPKEGLEITAADKKVRLWSLFPLYREELDLKLEKSSDIIEELFVKNGVTEILDPDRRNLPSVRHTIDYQCLRVSVVNDFEFYPR